MNISKYRNSYLIDKAYRLTRVSVTLKALAPLMVFAAALICGASVFTSCTVDNADNPATPKTKTVLMGMDFMGHPFYGDVTYSYIYDDDCRLVKMKEEQVGTDLVITDFDYTYTPGHITKQGRQEGYSVTEECSLDDHGRIVELVHTSLDYETQKVYHFTYTYTYDKDGRLATMSQLTEGEPIITTYIWEGGDLRSMSVSQEQVQYLMVDEYETSNVPAQAFFNHIGYSEAEELCQQGCFGVLPLHLPSKLTNTIYLKDVQLLKKTTEYSYTVTDGRVVAVSQGKTTYVLHWGQQ